MQAYAGEELKRHLEGLDKTMKRRKLMEELDEYADSSRSSRLACLYGLRQTGKTVMMQQEIARLNDYDATLLVDCSGSRDAESNPERCIFVQPGMRYARCVALSRAIASSGFFAEYSDMEKRQILKKLESDIMDRFLRTRRFTTARWHSGTTAT